MDPSVVEAMRKYRDAIFERLFAASAADRQKLLVDLEWATARLVYFDGREWVHNRMYQSAVEWVRAAELLPTVLLLSSAQAPAKAERTNNAPLPARRTRPKCTFRVGGWRCGAYLAHHSAEFCSSHVDPEYRERRLRSEAVIERDATQRQREREDRQREREAERRRVEQEELETAREEYEADRCRGRLNRPRWRDAESLIEDEPIALPIIEAERIEDPFDHSSLLTHRDIERVGNSTVAWAYSFGPSRASVRARRYEGFGSRRREQREASR